MQELDFLGPDFDRRVLLAVQLQHVDRTTELELDLSELFQAGYFANIEAIALLASERLAQQLASTGPIVVVTEGRADAESLERTLAITAPTVSHFFRFLDFESKVEGSSDQVVRILRSFSAAGVINRVIGVLDNDVAGRKALRQLDSSRLLPSVHYFTLPDVAYAESYPTLGPDGEKYLNVNGRAVSVEFLFGLDCLNSRSGEPIPVRWTGFDAGQQQYQGSLVDKKAVQDKIRIMLDELASGAHCSTEARMSMKAFTKRLIAAASPSQFPGQEFEPGASLKTAAGEISTPSPDANATSNSI